jgi:formylglycine-generating enzyme required for sulfatase activity
MPEVMISYARADARAFADRLAAALRGRCDAWLDTEAIEGGADWLRRIQEAITGCRVFVAVRSPAASRSFWVRSERLFALTHRKPVLPVVAADCPEDLELISYQPVDFRADFDRALERFLAEVGRLAGRAPPAADRPRLEQAYLGRVLLEHSVWQDLYTPMAGVAHLEVAAAPGKPRLVTLPATIAPLFHEFVAERLDTPAGRPRAEQRDYGDILPAVEGLRQLVVLGDPGSGKTTTLWRVAAEYARRAKDDPARPLPLLARLAELRADQTLDDFLAGRLGELAPFYPQLVRENRLALLLDGLNELPAAGRSRHAREIRALVGRCRDAGVAAVVTCRELDYVGELDVGTPRRVVIAPLDPGRIRRFVNAYVQEPAGAGDELFWQIAGQAAARSWEQLAAWGVREDPFWQAEDPPPLALGEQEHWLFHEAWRGWVEERSHPRSLLGLAANPYLLYMLTQVFTLRGSLPPNRGQLFGWFVDYLLVKRERLPEAEAGTLKRRLAELAYSMQALGDGTSLPRRTALGELGDERSLYLAQSANLLEGGDEVRFTHQLVQEFFAAGRLDAELKAETPAQRFWPARGWWEPHGWEETAVLLAGLYNDDVSPVVRWLADANPEVAARCVAESGAACPAALLDELRARWLPLLTELGANPRPEARAAVGRALGRLNLDDRAGVGVRPDGLPDVAWCAVPGRAAAPAPPDGSGVDWPGVTYAVPYTYWLAKYPVTYAQFRPFVESGAYGARHWWTEGGWRWRRGRRAPSYWNDPRWHLPNHPVVGVTWYEAFAYTRWLNDWARGTPGLAPAGMTVRLPTEAEWENAARYPDGRKFPWGDAYRPGYANVREKPEDAPDPCELRRTSAVGIYPQGASALGLLDLSGNAFDWCQSVASAEYRYPENNDPEAAAARVTRGGSWLRNVEICLAAYQEPVEPETVYDDQGFRLCAGPAVWQEK